MSGIIYTFIGKTRSLGDANLSLSKIFLGEFPLNLEMAALSSRQSIPQTFRLQQNTGL